MNTDALLLRKLPLEPSDRPTPNSAWERFPLASASDARLIEAVASAIMPPKLDSPSSFALHAPLELLARAALLTRVAPSARAAARRQIAAIATRYAQAGPEIELPRQAFDHPQQGLEALLAALREGNLDGSNAALSYLLDHLPLWQIRAALIDVVSPMLGAAGHAPIMLAGLPRLAHSIAGLGALLHAPLRSLARAAELRLSWQDHVRTEPPLADPEAELWLRLARVSPVVAASDSIAPTLLAVQGSGDAERLLAGPCRALTPPAAQRVLLRIAALSMLRDTPAHAPYGWTHCLSLPQAVLANTDASTDPSALVAIAATHVLAFRATQSTVALPLVWDAQALAGDGAADAPQAAAAGVYAADAASHPALITELATQAALHQDAHVAKYTLACLDAAQQDPPAGPLFLAAATYLQAWWVSHDGRSAS